MKIKPELKQLLILFFVMSATCGIQAQIQFEKHSIGATTNPLDVFVVDLDQDGEMDILTAANANGGEVRWWRNTGNMDFSQQAIETNLTSPRSVRAGDIDLDGDIDIIAAIYEANKILWWENDGSNQFTLHTVAEDFSGSHTVELCDLDQDGDIDVLCCEFDVSEATSDVAWWENDGNQNWTKHVVSSRFQQATFVYGADLDNDGDNDLVACGELNGELVWWENDGNMQWTEKVIDNAMPKIHTILPRDFDKDGDLDILVHACMSSMQAWYENDGSGIFTKHPMENLAGAIWLEQGDFDLDGDNDLIGTGMSATNLICYENNGQQELTGYWVEGGLTSGFALNVADMDGDHDLDVVAIGYNSNSLAWWENVSQKTLAFNEPKWLTYDQQDGTLYVSNEEAGDIAKSDASGNKCIIRNDFPVCTSTSLVNGVLWVNVATEIIGLDPQTGIRKNSYRLGAQFLSGLTADDQGFLYASDQPSGAIFKVNSIDGSTITLKTGLDYPQNLFYNSQMQKLILLDGEENVTIKVLDPGTGDISNQIVTGIRAGGAIVSDGLGNHYVSSPNENLIYAITNFLTDEPVIYADGLNQPHGMIYFSDDKELLIANTGDNTLQVVSATATGMQDWSGESQFMVYPNPATDLIKIYFPSNHKEINVSILDLTGKALWNRRCIPEASLLELSLENMNLTTGVYFIRIQQRNQVMVKRLVVSSH
ncbi:MAG: FG-GAP-like repeat-containing protein [Bacteroidota bacterium]|nr:FG-GAP-like repeat-containing protein [Bacteroidota bacterium]